MNDKNQPAEDLSNLDEEEKQLRNEAMEVDPVRAEDATIEDDVTRSERRAASGENNPAKKAEAAKTTDATKEAAEDAAAADQASKESADKKDDADKAKKSADDKKPADDEKNLSPYEKERRRLNKSWQQVEAEKTALRKEREEWEAARKQQEQERQTKPAQDKPAEELKDKDGYTAKQLEEAAADFKAEGKLDLAKIAEDRAKALRDEEAKTKTAAAKDGEQYVTLPTGARITPAEQAKMTSEWQANLKKLADENPELMKDGSPLRTEVTALLKGHPILHGHASGIHYAVQVAKLKTEAAQVPSLKTRITELEAENKRLTELTSLDPSGGGGAGRRDKPKVEDLPLEQQEAALREEAMSADSR